MSTTKHILVTGGTKGIGRAIIELFASQGFNVATCARNAEDLKSLKSELLQKHPDIKVFAEPCDVSSKPQIEEFLSALKEHFGSVDVLVNNAGIFIPGKVSEEADGVMEQLIHTNLFSAYYFTRPLLQDMLAKNEGYIFNMCSTASIMAYINGGSYCMSKFALLGFNKVLREETRTTQVKVTAILPGATLTDSWKGTDLPPERFMKADDVAQAVWNAYQMSGNTVIEELLIRPQAGDL